MASYDDFDESCEEEFLSDCVALPSNFQPGVIQIDTSTSKENIEVKKEIQQNAHEEEIAELNLEEICKEAPVFTDSQLNECERKKAFDEIEQNWHSYGLFSFSAPLLHIVTCSN